MPIPSAPPPYRPIPVRPPAQRPVLVVGAAFLLVGALGFVPGITIHVDQSFGVSLWDNVFRLFIGFGLIFLRRRLHAARALALATGLVYLVLFAVGSVVDGFGLWPNLVFAMVLLTLGSWLGSRRDGGSRDDPAA